MIFEYKHRGSIICEALKDEIADMNDLYQNEWCEEIIGGDAEILKQMYLKLNQRRLMDEICLICIL